MDAEMDEGIPLGNEDIASPVPRQRALFMTSSLVRALTEDDEPMISATARYLATRLPDLKQSVYRSRDGAYHLS